MFTIRSCNKSSGRIVRPVLLLALLSLAFALLVGFLSVSKEWARGSRAQAVGLQEAATPYHFASGGTQPHGIALLSSTNSPNNLDRAVIVHAGGAQQATLVDLNTHTVIASGTYVVGGTPEDVATDVWRGLSYVTRISWPPALVLAYRYDVVSNSPVDSLGSDTGLSYIALGSTLGPLPGSPINRAGLINNSSSPPSLDIYAVSNQNRYCIASVPLPGQQESRHVAIHSSSVNPLAVIANSGSGTVSIVSLLTNMVSGTVALGGYPFGVDINGTGTTALITNLGLNSAALIDLHGSGSLIATIPGLAAPRGVAIDRNRLPNVAVVANSSSNTVTFINMNSGTVMGHAATGFLPYSVAVDPNLHLAYVTNAGDDTVSAITIPDTTSTPAAGLRAVKTASITDIDGSATLSSGDALIYVVQVDNTSQSASATLQFRDNIPPQTNSPTVIHVGGGIASYPFPGQLQIDGIVIPPASSRTIVFQVLVNGNLNTGMQICNQGSFYGRRFGSSINDLSVVTDNPFTPAYGDATCLHIGDPLVSATMNATLISDSNTNGLLDPGDRLRYQIAIRNRDSVAGASIQFINRLPVNTSFVAGSLLLSDPPAGPFPQSNPLGGSINLSGLLLGAGELITVQYDVVVGFVPVGTIIYNSGHVIVAQAGKGPWVLVTHDSENSDSIDNAAESGNNSANPGDDNPSRRRVGS